MVTVKNKKMYFIYYKINVKNIDFFYKLFTKFLKSSNMFEIKIKPLFTDHKIRNEKPKEYKVNLDYLYKTEVPSPPKLRRQTAEDYEPIKLYSLPLELKILDTQQNKEYSAEFFAHMGGEDEILGFYDEKILMYSLSGQKFLSSCAMFKKFKLVGAYKDSINVTQFYFREENDNHLFVIDGKTLKYLLYYSNKKYT